MNIRRQGAVIVLTALFVVLLTALPAFARDANHNKIPDSWERKHHLSVSRNLASRDPDHDRLTNYNEWRSHTNPRVKDSDHDGKSDPKEDYDRDGLTNIGEVKSRTNICVRDSDHDGIRDAREDPDHDRLRNAQEIRVATNPRKADTDGDGLTDDREDRDHDGLGNEAEFAEGTNPNDDDSDNDGVEDGDEVGGIIVSFDADTGLLEIKSFNDSGTVFDVTVDDDTEFEWAGDTDAAEPTAEALVPGTIVKEIELEEDSLIASKIELRPAGGGLLVARVAEFDEEYSLLKLEAAREDDCKFRLLVTDATVFEWAEGVTSDHVAGVDDLLEGTGVAAYETELDGEGHRIATRLVLVPRASSGFEEDDEDD
jgi:hypothetical protein